MNKRVTYPIILTILTIIGLIFSYFLLYDIEGFERLLGIEQPESAQVGQNNYQLNQGIQPLTPNNVRLADVVAPNEAYFREDGRTFKLNSPRVMSTISSLLESRPIVLEDMEMVENAGSVAYFHQVDHVQVVFPERLPIGVYSHFITLPEDQGVDMYVDRFFIPLVDDEENRVYIVDSRNNRYMTGSLSTNLSYQDIESIIDREDVEYAEVYQYDGADHPIYLPVENKVIDSQVFTLELIPENVYINQVFEGANYNVSEISSSADNNMYRYQNYLYTLDINRFNHRMTLTLNRVDQGSPRSLNEKIRNSLNALRTYDYWQGDVRIDHFTNNLVSYRQFYQGYPIHAASQLTDSPLPDYGRTTVQLRNDISGDIYRINQSMIDFGIHIDNLSEPVEIENYQEILAILQDQGYALVEFQDVFVGYEWMPDTEGFRKLELQPNWIFKFAGSFYTLDEIQQDSFDAIWQRETGGDN